MTIVLLALGWFLWEDNILNYLAKEIKKRNETDTTES